MPDQHDTFGLPVELIPRRAQPPQSTTGGPLEVDGIREDPVLLAMSEETRKLNLAIDYQVALRKLCPDMNGAWRHMMGAALSELYYVLKKRGY